MAGPNRSAVVTGASSGIGRATALLLADRGWRVFAGVRTPAAAASLPSVPGLTPIQLDITDAGSIAAAREVVAAAGPLTGVVNNAGTTIPCPVEYLALADFRQQLEVNLTGHLAVTQAFLPLLRRPGGRIVNISSPGAKISAPFMAPYVAAKSGLEGLSGVLRVELAPAGIGVSIIEPGYVATGMRDKLRRDTSAVLARLPATSPYGEAMRAVMDGVVREAANGADPSVVAKAILRALTDPRPRVRYAAGPRAGRLLVLARLLPDRLLDRVVARMIKLPVQFRHPA